MLFNYSDFQSGAIRGFQFAKGCCRNEYRNGILNAAKARLFEQDLNKDGVLTFDEFVSANEYANQKNNVMNCQSPAGLCSYGDFVNTKQAKMRMQAEDFKALDVNQDGVLDKRELANEINLMDRLGGKEDGKVTQRGFNALWGNSDPRQISAMLRNNYLDFNAKNLGMPWDKGSAGFSRDMGEMLNPYNLNNPLATRMTNPVQQYYPQQIISPMAPQAFNPIRQMFNPIRQMFNPMVQQMYNPMGQMYNPIGFRPMAQSMCPCKAAQFRQFANNNVIIRGMQNIMNQMFGMMRTLNFQNYAYQY